MAHKQQLHELLKEDQEPFQLNNYISQKLSQFKINSTKTPLHLTKCKSNGRTSNKLIRNLRFFSFQNSPDLRKSPFPDLISPVAMSPCKSPNGGVFLNIPSRTATILMEAAMRIQKQSKPRVKGKNFGFRFFGSFLNRLKYRSKKKTRVIGDNELKSSRLNENKIGEKLEIENVQLEISGDFDLLKTRFCSSPFRFSLHRSPSSSGDSTPEFCSPEASPSRHVMKEKENRETENPVKEEEKDKEQCSPVSVLDPPSEDYGQESPSITEDHECTYANNVDGSKHQLLSRLRRFGKIAELDPVDLEKKLHEGSESEYKRKIELSSEDHETLSHYRNETEDSFVTEVFKQSHLVKNSTTMSTVMKRLVSDLIVEERSDSGNTEVVLGRIRKRLDLWKRVEFDTIDMMIELDFKREFDGWTKFHEQMEETVAEIELAVFDALIEELLYMAMKYNQRLKCNKLEYT